MKSIRFNLHARLVNFKARICPWFSDFLLHTLLDRRKVIFSNIKGKNEEKRFLSGDSSCQNIEMKNLRFAWKIIRDLFSL